MRNVAMAKRQGGGAISAMLRKHVVDRCEALGIDLIDMQLGLCQSDDPEVSQRALSAIYPYIWPKLSNVTLQDDSGNAIKAFTLVVQRPADQPSIEGELVQAVVQEPDPLS